jgi:hypothetical protein
MSMMSLSRSKRINIVKHTNHEFMFSSAREKKRTKEKRREERGFNSIHPREGLQSETNPNSSKKKLAGG